jgi:ribosomal protein S6--L-glutamate ligase
MKIAILSRGPRLYSTRRIKEAAHERGHEARVLNPLNCSIEVAEGSPRLYYRNKRLSSYDAVVPRIGASVTFFGTAVVRQFEQMGVFCVNPSHAISVSRDKLRALQVLSRHRIGMPTTLFVRHVSEILPGIERMGGPPVVVKLLEGTQGIGVILADSTKVAKAIIETLSGPAKMSVLLQQFIKESKGRDIRAFVVGNRVVAAMRRTAAGDEFRSNLHRGGTAEVVQLDEQYTRTAVHAAQILGLRVAGVDLLEGKKGPVLMEVNSSPGLEGIESATGVDVAGEIIRLIEEQVLFPEIDIRQRLTLQAGYGVMEIPIDERSELCGTTIRESGLRDRDVIVLTIQRDRVTIPNPRVDRQILAGDVLLCFGKNLTLKGLAPPRRGQGRPRQRADATEPAPGLAPPREE